MLLSSAKINDYDAPPFPRIPPQSSANSWQRIARSGGGKCTRLWVQRPAATTTAVKSAETAAAAATTSHQQQQHAFFLALPRFWPSTSTIHEYRGIISQLGSGFGYPSPWLSSCLLLLPLRMMLLLLQLHAALMANCHPEDAKTSPI